MKTTTILTLLACMLINYATPAVSSGPYCRKIHTVSRCVDKPIIRGPNPWCVFHMCGPKFVEAKLCPPGKEQATHKCIEKQGRRNTWVCINGKKIKPYWLPIGCKGKRCKTEVVACRCKRRFNVDRRKFVRNGRIPTPKCGPPRWRR